MQLLNQILSATGLLPHGYCLQWNPALLWTLIISDSTTAISYFSIPFAIWYFANKRKDIPHRWLFLMFGLFIIACGVTHAFDVMTIWIPNYWGNAIAKAITAALSLWTAIMIWRILPRALLAPSSQQLAQAKRELEISNADLEDKIQLRTAELANANIALHHMLESQAALSETVKKDRALLRGVIDNIPDLIFFKDTRSSYLGCNKAFEEFFWGYRE